jgi:DNA-binding winged helix-turn-helix (wHTH) protein
LRYYFEDHTLDTDRRELRRGADLIPLAPQLFDLLQYLIRNRDRVVSKDDIISAIWNGRIVSDAALTTRLNAARTVVGDTGEKQHLIKTLPRKGFSLRRNGPRGSGAANCDGTRQCRHATHGLNASSFHRGAAVRKYRR